MGLCASQARLLMLTARKSDLEYRRMQITNAKQMLAMQEEAIATKYSDALANMKTQVKTADNGYQDLTFSSLMNAGVVIGPDGKEYPKYVVTFKASNGQTAYLQDGNVPSLENGEKGDGDDLQTLAGTHDTYVSFGSSSNGSSMYRKIASASAEEFAAMVASGEIVIQEYNPDKGGYFPINPSSSPGFKEENNTSDDALAEAEYDREMTKIKRKETALDLEAQQIETQYSAVTTEIESVQSLVKKNVEKGMKYFS